MASAGISYKAVIMGSEKIPVGVIGVGMVGGALARWFEKQGHRVFLFDLHKGLGAKSAVNNGEVVFVAVPTPFDESNRQFDGSAVEDAVSRLSGSKTVVIKSTVLPGTTESLQQRYPSHRFLFSPEFLTETTADEDMAKPRMNIVGWTEQSREVAAGVMGLLARAAFERIIPSREAEIFKYLRNVFFSTKVVFFNQMYDLAEKLGVDYEIIRECAANDPWIGGQHTVVWHQGYRGYGGKCLPKDTRALISFSEGLGVGQELLKTIESINKKLNGIAPPSASKLPAADAA